MKYFIPLSNTGWAKKYFLLLSLFLILEGQTKASEPVVIDYFFEPGCRECKIISDTVLPTLSNTFNGKYSLNYRDVGIMTNYLALVRCQQTADSIKNEPVYMAVNERRLFSGLSEIQTGFLAAVDEIIHERPIISANKVPAVATNLAAEISGRQTESSPRRSHASGLVNMGRLVRHSSLSDGGSLGHLPDSRGLLDFRFRQFTVFGVLLAGLVDGINPCAISTLIFLVSVLVIAGFRNSRLIAVGIAYCLASFLTYTAIGFGLFRLIHNLEGFSFVRRGLELLMAGLLIVMACFSFKDAWKYHLSKDPNSITLKLPRRIKLIMNSVMRLFSTTRHALLAAFIIGVLVTLLETVCTGQVYVPTLVLIIKSGASPFLGLIYLLLYNLMFILPLVIVFVLILYGIKVQHLIDWSKRQVVKSKVIMGCLFVVLALVFILL